VGVGEEALPASPLNPILIKGGCFSMDDELFQKGLEIAKSRYCAWWNRSWLPNTDWLALIHGLSIHFTPDKESGGLMPYDSGGAIPSSSTWREIAEQVEKFYAIHSDAKIDRFNWFDLAKKHMPEAVSPRKVKNPARQIKGFVYLLRSGDYYKIGYAKNTHSRVALLEPKLPLESEIICEIRTGDVRDLERSLHEDFKEKRVRGEWFMLNDEDVEFIKRLASEDSDTK
jgi:hypothetical protein